MVWPTQALSLQKGYERAAAQIDSIKRIATNNIVTLAAGPVPASYIFALAENLIGTYRVLATVSALSGIAEHISREEQGARTAQQVTDDFTAIQAALLVAFQEIVTKSPVDADGYLLIKRLNPDFTTTEREFDTATTATLRGLLGDLIALID